MQFLPQEGHPIHELPREIKLWILLKTRGFQSLAALACKEWLSLLKSFNWRGRERGRRRTVKTLGRFPLPCFVSSVSLCKWFTEGWHPQRFETHELQFKLLEKALLLSPEVALWLVSRENPFRVERFSYSASFLAVREGNLEVLCYLFSFLTHPNRRRGRELVYRAAWQGRLDILCFLKEKEVPWSATHVAAAAIAREDRELLSWVCRNSPFLNVRKLLPRFTNPELLEVFEREYLQVEWTPTLFNC